MSKPTLTHEQSEALQVALKHDLPHVIMRDHAIKPTVWYSYIKRGALAELDIMTMAAALVNGWETEKTPIDILRVDYRKRCGYRIDSFNDGWCDGVRKTLEATGQVVEGINA